MTSVVQGGEDCWRGPTFGADYAGAELNADDNDISGWHGGIIWTDQDYELERGDNNAPNPVADVCRFLFSCSTMPVPKWRGVRTGSEVLSQEDAAKIFGPLEGNWSMEFVNALASRVAERTEVAYGVAVSQLWQRLSVTLWRATSSASLVPGTCPRAEKPLRSEGLGACGAEG